MLRLYIFCTLLQSLVSLTEPEAVRVHVQQFTSVFTCYLLNSVQFA